MTLRGAIAAALALIWLAATCQVALAGHVPGEVLVRFRAQARAAAPARHEALGARVAAVVPRLGLERVRLPAGLSVEEALRHYRSLPEVELAQPNYRYRAALEPNDEFYPHQWHLPRIHAPAAWDTNVGSRDIVVAVVDTGVDYTHPDLADNIWPGLGWDFANDDNDPMDDYAPSYHGTQVAGVIGAVGDNGLEVSGVCWRVRVMALKALDENGDGTTVTVAQAISWAAAHGAHLINLSLEAEEPAEDAALRQAMRDCGVLVVCAAGNGSLNVDVNPVYPGGSDLANVINTASSNSSDSLAPTSNYGEVSVDLAAPGQAVWGLDEALLSGTSVSAAVVSGAAALILAAQPGLHYSTLKAHLINTCDAAQLPVASGGRLNVAAALAAARQSAAGSSDGDGGGCFIATAAYGSPLRREIYWLSAFRNRWLAGWLRGPPPAQRLRPPGPPGRPLPGRAASPAPPGAGNYCAHRAPSQGSRDRPLAAGRAGGRPDRFGLHGGGKTEGLKEAGDKGLKTLPRPWRSANIPVLSAMTRLDYYELLGVERTAGHAEVKTAYRRLALRHHPDRNGGDPGAEERFKAISEAYAVLSDPAKRTAYDLSRTRGASSFGYSQQDIFADLLRTMAAGRMGEFGAEFSRSGLRFDEAFLRQVFFGGGPFVVRGFFFAGSPSGAAVFRSARRAPAGPPSMAGRLLAPVGRWLLKAAGKAALAVVGFGLRRLERRLVEAQQAQAGTLDLTYRISVSPRQAQEGADIELTYPRGIRPQRLAVRIPPGTSPGETLRLEGMGLERRGRRGDLLLVVDVC